MDVSHYSTASHFLCWEGAQNLIFLFEIWFGRNDLGLTIIAPHMLSEASTINLIYLKEGYETFKQQWSSLLTTQHPLFCADLVPKTCNFAWNLRVSFCGNRMGVTRRGQYMIPEALYIILIHLREILKYSTSNGCLSSQHIISFPVLILCLKFANLLDIWESFCQKMTWCWP